MKAKIVDAVSAHFRGLTMNVLCACVSQAVWSGFDASFLWIMCHEKFEAGTELLIASCVLNGSIFLGSVIAATVLRKWNDWLCTFTVSCIKAAAILLMGFIPINLALYPLLFISGIGIGVIQSILISYSVRKCSTIQNTILIPVIYACFAGGSFVSSILLEIGHSAKHASRVPFLSFNVIETMHVQTRYPSTILLSISAAFQLSTLYPVYALWKSTAADPNREEYEDLANPASKNLISVFMLTSIMGFFVSSLQSIFPYYLFAYLNDEPCVIYYVLFMASYTCGRFANIGISRKNWHNIVLSLSLVGCGVSICCFSYPELRGIASALFGFSLTIVLPTLTLFLMQLKGTSIHPLICGSTFGPLAFPLLVTQAFNNFGKELFTSINFFSLLIIVFLFVCLLNIQSKMDKPQDEPSAKVWKWFRGEGSIRRARSFRKFISSVRASFRSGRYSKMNINSRSTTPTPMTARSPMARSPSPNLSAMKAYRTIRQSKSGATLHNNSIDEEFSSTGSNFI